MNLIYKRLRVTAALLLTLAGAASLSSAVFAYDATSTSAINVEQGAVILHGYDPVAYFAAGQPTQGDPKFAARHAGAVYHFASAANLAAFQANPEHYVPQFGGFCAMGVALGKKLDVDPTVFKVVDDKLYLNLNADVFQAWSQDIPGHIAQAQGNWPAVRDQAPDAL